MIFLFHPFFRIILCAFFSFTIQFLKRYKYTFAKQLDGQLSKLSYIKHVILRNHIVFNKM